MNPYQESVFKEKEELDKKLAALREFYFGNSDEALTLAPEERDRLGRQYDAMKTYSDILGERIAAFDDRYDECDGVAVVEPRRLEAIA